MTTSADGTIVAQALAMGRALARKSKGASILAPVHAISVLELLADQATTFEDALEALKRLELAAARYAWLRDGNGYEPEENYVRGGEKLDRLCDEGILEDAKRG